MNAQPPIGTDPVTLDTLADLPVWVAWQAMERNGKVTKVPFVSLTRQARANAEIWLTRHVAQKVMEDLPRPHGIGGVGIEFCTSDDGRALGGIDLDTCRDPETGAFTDWALGIIERLDSYTEISPSETGAKIFFTYRAADLPAMRAVMGSAQWSKLFARAGNNHPPAIEIHLGNRYFAVTDKILDGMPREFRLIDTATIIDLLSVIGPAFSEKGADSVKAKASDTKPDAADPTLEPNNPDDPDTDLLTRINRACALSRKLAQRWNGDWTGCNDRSGSGKAFTLAAALKREGFDFEDMVAALHLHHETSEWARTKGEDNQRRELLRIWERIEVRLSPRDWLRKCQRDDSGEPRPNLFNTMLAVREDTALSDLMGFDEMLRAPLLMKPVSGSSHPVILLPRPLKDADVTAVQEYLQRAGLEKVGKDTVHQATDSRALERAFHPVRDYLNALVWDGTKRLDTWLRDYLGAENTEPPRVCRRLFGLSHAAMAVSSSMAWYCVSASAGGILPIGSSSRRWLNQSTHSRVANSTASNDRHGPRRWITSAL